MNDDWRLKVDLREHGFARRLSELLAASELEHDLERAFHDRVVVSVDGHELFAYTGSRQQAERAEAVVRRLAGEHGWDADIELARWNAAGETWDPPDAPIGDPAHDHAERIAAEREESADRGYPEYEVRIECASRSEAADVSRRLSDESIPHLHRWSYVLVGADDEDSANALAARLRDEAPEARAVTVERNQRAIYDDLPRSPFSVMGGLFG